MQLLTSRPTVRPGSINAGVCVHRTPVIATPRNLSITKNEVNRISVRVRSASEEKSTASQPKEPKTQAQQQEEQTVESQDSINEFSTEEQEEPQLTALERARQALKAEQIDDKALEASLAEIEEDMARLQEATAAADARATNAENTLSVAKDQLVRLNADFDNFRKRSAGEKEQIASRVRSEVVSDLLPLVDNFELARTQVKAQTEAENKINNSYQSLYKQMVDIMRSFGIDAVPTVNTPFDPELHEAMMREHSNEIEDGYVLEEFRKGFKMGDRLVRPAMVKVSMGPAEPQPPKEQPAPQQEQEQPSTTGSNEAAGQQ